MLGLKITRTFSFASVGSGGSKGSKGKKGEKSAKNGCNKPTEAHFVIPTIIITPPLDGDFQNYISPMPTWYRRDRLAPAGRTHSETATEYIFKRQRKSYRSHLEIRRREKEIINEEENDYYVYTAEDGDKDLPTWGKRGIMEQAKDELKEAYKAVMDAMRDMGDLINAGTYKLGRKAPAWYE